QRALREGVLDDLVGRLRAAQLTPQIGDLRNVQSAVIDQNCAFRPFERRFQRLELGFFICSRYSHLGSYRWPASGFRLWASGRSTRSLEPKAWSLLLMFRRGLDVRRIDPDARPHRR